MSKRILISICTKDRISLAGLCLSSVTANKHSSSDVVVYDDGSKYSESWRHRWRVRWEYYDTKVPGQISYYRFAHFITDPRYDFLLLLDSDVIVAQHFDVEILTAWQAAGADWSTVGTGYYSRIHVYPAGMVYSPQYRIIPSVGGVCQMHTKTTATAALKIIGSEPTDWKQGWDSKLWPEIGRCVCTPQSVVQHIGIYEGMNSNSENVSGDYAEDFIGYQDFKLF